MRWGPPGGPSPPCQNRDQVLAWYQRGRDAGTRARVTGTLVSGDRILAGLKVTGQAADAGEKDRWQVLTVRRGRITSITGFDDRDEAAACAGLAAAPARQPQTTRWAAPRHLCMPKTASTSCDQAIFVDQATGACLCSDAVLAGVDWLG